MNQKHVLVHERLSTVLTRIVSIFPMFFQLVLVKLAIAVSLEIAHVTSNMQILFVNFMEFFNVASL